MPFYARRVLKRLGESSPAHYDLLAQMLGAALLGFALLDWVSRHSPLGGIYARPLAAGNLVHFGVGCLVLARRVVNDPQNAGVLWAWLSIYAVLMAGFAVALFRSRADVV